MQELTQAQFLSLLRQRGIEISVKEERLQISAPTGAVDAQLRAELLRRKPDLLQALRIAPPPHGRPLVPMERNGRIPQTHAQQGMWLIDHFTPGNVAYNIPEAFIVEGPVDLKSLQIAVDRLIARHETLRTRFYEDEGDLLQAISDSVAAPVGFTDISTTPEKNRDRVLRGLIREHARQPFDLNQPPLVRFHLFRLTKQRHAIFFNIHHIISDRQSLAILQQELIALYHAAVRNESALLPELAVQYADYAIWANRHLAEGALAEQIQYWKTKLAGAPPWLDLFPGRSYPEQRTAWGANVLFAIPTPMLGSLTELCRQEGATMFMTLLAAFAVLLHKQSGKNDFCLGSPFTHRNQVETEPIIGLFVNMLVFRCQFDGELTFREFLRHMRVTALEAYEHSDVPFQELVRALKPDLRLLRSPLFQIMFGFDSNVRAGQSVLAQFDTDPGTAKFDLTLQLQENSKGISGWFEYCTDLFDAATIEQLSAQFGFLLGEIVRQPDQPISAINLQPTTAAEPIPIAIPQHSGFWKEGIKKFTQRWSLRSSSPQQ